MTYSILRTQRRPPPPPSSLIAIGKQIRTAAAVKSLRALVEITANTSDSIGRAPFSGPRTGEVLLSILRGNNSAVLQVMLISRTFTPFYLFGIVFLYFC